MKKIAFLMVCMFACMMTACSESESEYATDVAYGTIVGTSPVTVQTDDSQTLIVTDTKPLGSDFMYQPDYGQRVLIYYKRFVSADTGSETNQIKLFGYIHFADGDSEIVATSDDNTYGDVAMDIYQPNGYYNLVHLTKKVLDICLVFPATTEGYKNHTFTLVLNEEEPVTDNNYLQLTLCHSAPDSEADSKQLGANYHTFDMTLFEPYFGDTQGVRLVVAGLDKKEITHDFQWAK